MNSANRALGRHRPAFLLAFLLLLALLAPAGPLGLRARVASLYAPLALLAGKGNAEPEDPAVRARRLEEELIALRAQVEGLRRDNDLLREFRGLKLDVRSRTARVLAANILGSDRLSPLRRSVLIDLGTRDGVAVGQPVVSGRSLLGIVAEAGPSCSLVRLLDDPGGRAEDPASRVAVQILRPGAEKAGAVEGIVVGERKGRLRLRLVPAGSVAPGDLVLTSSADPLIPPGLLLGRVVSVDDDRRTRLAEAVVEPAGDLAGLSTLLVLQLAPPSLEASAKGVKR